MNKKLKLFLGIAGLIIIGLGIASVTYLRFLTLQPYSYTSPKGQQYNLRYFKDSQLVDSTTLTSQSDSSNPQPGTPVLAHYFDDTHGIAIYISDAIDKPFTKTCTGTDRFAFSVGDYEVCKGSSEGKTGILLGKVGNNGQYFLATFVAVSKTNGSQQSDLLDHQKEIKQILSTITPVNE